MAAPPARSRRLPGAVCASGARLPPPHPGLLSARPQPARVHRPPARRTQRTSRGDARPLLHSLAFPWAPTFRYHPTSLNLAFFIKRRILWKSKWEQTVKCWLDVRSPIILSSLIPSLLTCAPLPSPTFALTSPLPITLLICIPCTLRAQCPSPPSFCHQPTPPPFVYPPSPASSVYSSAPRPSLLSLRIAIRSLPGSTHAYLSIILPTLTPIHPSVESVFPTALLFVTVTVKHPPGRTGNAPVPVNVAPTPVSTSVLRITSVLDHRLNVNCPNPENRPREFCRGSGRGLSSRLIAQRHQYQARTGNGFLFAQDKREIRKAS